MRRVRATFKLGEKNWPEQHVWHLKYGTTWKDVARFTPLSSHDFFVYTKKLSRHAAHCLTIQRIKPDSRAEISTPKVNSSPCATGAGGRASEAFYDSINYGQNVCCIQSSKQACTISNARNEISLPLRNRSHMRRRLNLL